MKLRCRPLFRSEVYELVEPQKRLALNARTVEDFVNGPFEVREVDEKVGPLICCFG